MIIKDFTDNDLYKFTTMNAIQKKFPKAEVTYKFFNRGNTSFPADFDRALRQEIDEMKHLQMSKEAEDFIKNKCYYFDPVFIDLLKGYRFNPDEVSVNQKNGELDIEISGLWYRTVLWEVPILAIISELYYKMTDQYPNGLADRAVTKAKEFADIQAEISEFGTRRRFSFYSQNEVLKIFKAVAGKFLNGTSNVYLAMKHNLIPIGTHPHEWFMYHGASFGYRMANAFALKNWVDVYGGSLGIALTDTYTTDNFFRCFNTKFTKLFDGIRWDSGDPLEFTDKAIAHYNSMRIDPKTKTIVYSDALDLEKVKEIKKHVNNRIHDVYGIGTYLSNDVGAIPLNMVIKLSRVKPEGYHNYIPAVKLSDVESKHTGDSKEIDICLKTILIE